jgi:hypothetical protein
MRRWRETDFVRDLQRLLRHARKNAGALPPQPLSGDFIYQHGADWRSFLIESDAMPLLRSLQRQVVGSSRKKLGLSAEEAGALLLAACDDAIAGTIKGAVEAFVARIESPIEDWIVAEPIEMLYIPAERLEVGRTTYSRRVPRSVARRKVLEMVEGQGFAPPVAFVTVQARDKETAQILAGERFAESSAVLDLINRPKPTAGRIMLTRQRDGSGSFSFGRSGWIINDAFVDDRGRLVAPYRQLSRAAARDESRRSDWERRVLAATRWFSRGCRSEWPADRLASLMVALECLFVAGRAEREKGSLIANRLTERFRAREMSEDEQVDWLKGLYRSRNDAVHEGREFLHDLEVDRLLDLTQAAVRSFAEHLVPAHRPRGRSCRTFTDAMRCSRPMTPYPSRRSRVRH